MEKRRSTMSETITLNSKQIESVTKFAKQIEVATRAGVSPHELIDEKPVFEKFQYNKYGVLTQTRVESAEDLIAKPAKAFLNPPPKNGRCNCCGRHISDLKPYGKAGDPLVGNFEGALLLKHFRRLGPYNEECILAFDEAQELYEVDGYSDPEEWLFNKYGETKGRVIFAVGSAWYTTGSSWECRDCFILDSDEYFDKQSMRSYHEEKE